jgi:SNF2 family DNA or RNA helicase
MCNRGHQLTSSGEVLVGIETARDRIRELEALEWSVIFIDEAHRLKNRKSSTYKALSKFVCKARFGLTVRPFLH